jgi:hypothetical protein
VSVEQRAHVGAVLVPTSATEATEDIDSLQVVVARKVRRPNDLVTVSVHISNPRCTLVLHEWFPCLSIRTGSYDRPRSNHRAPHPHSEVCHHAPRQRREFRGDASGIG